MGGLGNLILTIPALKTLRINIPRAKITLLLGEPYIENIIKDENLYDDILLLDRRGKTKMTHVLDMVKQARNHQFDLAIVASHTNAFKSSFLLFCMRIPLRLGQDINGQSFFYTHKIPLEQDTHETDGTCQVVGQLGLQRVMDSPQLTPTPRSAELAQQFLHDRGINSKENLIGIHPGSGFKQKYKRWSHHKFASLCDQLIDQYQAQIVITGGPSEVSLANDISKIMKGYPVNAAGKLSLNHTAALIQHCNLFISNDSGLAHIAAAVQTPLIVLFGSTNEKRIAPRGKNIHILRRKKTSRKTPPSMLINAITETDVLNQVKSIIKTKQS